MKRVWCQWMSKDAFDTCQSCSKHARSRTHQLPEALRSAGSNQGQRTRQIHPKTFFPSTALEEKGFYRCPNFDIPRRW